MYNNFPQNMYNNYPYAVQQNFQQQQLPHYEVIKVNGKPGVDVSNIRGGIKTGLSKWLEWENGTLSIFKESYKYVFDEDVMFGDLLKNLISDVEGEIKTINESILRNKATDYDIIVIMSEQDAYCKKYKNKIKHSIDFSDMGV